MSGYRRVNYYELCRLCTSSEGAKINIFLEEGRRRQLQTKIQTYLPVQVMEDDSLPKIVCMECIKKLESYIEFREIVVNAEGMLESYFTSLRFSEDFLKEGKVYVKSTKIDKPTMTEDSNGDETSLNAVDKIVPTTTTSQILTEHSQTHQQPQQVLVSSITTPNVQLISGTRVQQFKSAMQMQSGNVTTAVIDNTVESHYSYQQQQQDVTQQISTQQNQTQNQIIEQQSQASQVQNQDQLHNQSQISQQQQQQQVLRQLQQQQSQQSSSQASQVIQQVHEQTSQTQLNQHLQQLQRQRNIHHLDKHQHSQHIHTNVQGEVHRNIIIKAEDVNEQQQQQQAQLQIEVAKANEIANCQQTYTTVQATPEVLFSLGFKDALTAHVQRDDNKEIPKDAIQRSVVNHIPDYIRIRPGQDQQTPLVAVNSHVITQNTPTQQQKQPQQFACRECGKTFNTLNQMNGHDCTSALLNEVTDITNNTGNTTVVIKKEESGASHQVNGNHVVSTVVQNATTCNNLNSAFSCDICNKPFKRKEHLFQHRKLHTGERPYVCTNCTKAFSRKEHLVRHLVSHTGQKQHECEICGKSFSRKDNLHKHRKTHGMCGPYICEHCGKNFVIKHYYLMHLTTHAPTQAATPVDDLNSNGSVSCLQDPLPHKCDVCHKAFSVKQYLTTHKLRHRPKPNNSSNAIVAATSQEQQQQVNQTNEITVTRDITCASLGTSSVANTNSTVIEMQNVPDRSEQQTQNDAFNTNHYQGNISQYQ